MNKKKAAEKVLVLKREDVFKDGVWHGINSNVVDNIIRLSYQKGEYKRRGDVEDDPNYQQIIPYVVFNYVDQYFLMQRVDDATEKRLANLYSLGIGGHIRKEDLRGSKDVVEWARREIKEEVNYEHKMEYKILGVLNARGSAVNEVHLGIVILAQGDSSEISIKDEHKKGQLLTINNISEYYEQMEVWSKITLDYLKENS